MRTCRRCGSCTAAVPRARGADPPLSGQGPDVRAGLRHDRGVARRLHGHPRRHRDAPDVGRGAALLHRRRAAARRPTGPAGGAPAELAVRGPHMFAGYWNRPEETEAAFVDGRWFRTGDVLPRSTRTAARTSSTGSRTCIISGGENVYPAEVEAVAAPRHRGHLRGRRGRRRPVGRGRRPPSCSCARAVAHRRRAAHPPGSQPRPYKVPEILEFVAELPHNATGKIRRVELRHRAPERPNIRPTPSSPAERDLR